MKYISKKFIAKTVLLVPLLSVSALSLLAAGASRADEPVAAVLHWKLSDDFRGKADKANPNSDRDDQPTWHFLRTNEFNGPVETRQWLRNGKYVPLTEQGDNLFESPLDGWAYRAGQRLAPLVGKITADYDVGLKFKAGDMLIAPGPEHAVVIGWRSPVAGMLEIQGAFEHAQNCCGVNSQIKWYIERGSAPDEIGFQPTPLAAGSSDFGSPNQVGKFHIKDQPIQPGEFVYFTVDAVADGTGTPHHGDATRFDVTLTVRDAKRPPPPSFEKDVLPILAQKCHDCHGADVQEAKLDLRTLSAMIQGGESGPAIVSGDPGGSLLVDLLARDQMPPEGSEKLTATELASIRRWVKARTPAEEKVVALPPRTHVSKEDRSFWAFQPPRKSDVPQVQHAERVRSPIDAFLISKLEARGLTFSPEADRATLIRRAYFDLIGLPPEPGAVQAFVDDPRPDAYEHLVDELLTSPHYGERWGRHWLDAAGYVDNRLFDGDLSTIYPNEGIWRYRDYVVNALNDDKPYDRFLTEQLAGDELVDWRRADSFTPETLSLLSATGYLRCVEDHTSEPQYGIDKRYEVINQVIDMFSTSVLGLTMECCRCHNHKYDPLPQRDYYRLMACFEPAFNVHDWKRPQERFLADVSLTQRAAIETHNAALDKQIADLQPALKAAEEAKEEARTAELKKQIGDLQGQRKSYGKVQALWDVGPAPTSRVHRRGNVHAPGVLVQAGFPEILQPPGSSLAATAGDVSGESSGRRLALARWLTRPEHPLTGRVIVNRVWHHHFGRGIVETPGNFGRSGSPPTHPELLDWLTVDFVEHGWSLKRLHKRIMLSSAWRQSSRRPRVGPDISISRLAPGSDPKPKQEPDASAFRLITLGEQIDPGNALLWRMNLRRLESEIVRDSILTASGALDRTAGGPPVEITKPADGLSETASHRRSLYLFARRVYPLKFLEIFDAPIMPVNCTQRMSSATVLQSLAQLNSEFLFEQADRMAQRVVDSARADSAAQIEFAFQLALSRKPQAAELKHSLAFVREQAKNHESTNTAADKATRMALADLCHMLLSTSEFLYVE
ncbi:MAG: PSD1 and planctomycete cytochrome C domain-containing protein [Planctomycetota bacterium]|nr:PSD1 and planctomycete cytochrome C domain-containing protein [Planctomycetota bacterium]